MPAKCPACDEQGFDYDAAKDACWCSRCLFTVNGFELRSSTTKDEAPEFLLQKAFEFNLREFRDA